MDGAASLSEAARLILGAQAQTEVWAYFALASRTAGCPDESVVEQATQEPTKLVRTWGQRDTLHLYALEDWPLFTTLRLHWARGARVGGEPPQALIGEVSELFRERARPMARSEFFEMLPTDYVESLRSHRGSDGSDAGTRRFAASRVIQALAHRGLIAFWGKSGSEVTYLHRDAIWAGAWPEFEPEQAALEITRRYFASFAPANGHDLAHYLGVKVTDARRWMSSLGGELTECSHPEFGSQWILTSDEESFRNVPDDDDLTLLAGYDTMLMGHKNKRWIMPDKAWEKMVWASSARVMPSVLHRGRIVGVWHPNLVKKDHFNLQVQTFPGFPAALKPRLREQLERFASHSSSTFRIKAPVSLTEPG